jgi:hypothetical protein
LDKSVGITPERTKELQVRRDNQMNNLKLCRGMHKTEELGVKDDKVAHGVPAHRMSCDFE